MEGAKQVTLAEYAGIVRARSEQALTMLSAYNRLPGVTHLIGVQTDLILLTERLAIAVQKLSEGGGDVG